VGAVHVQYVTDPACPCSWAAEPAVRRLQVEFGDQVSITYVMGGLAREFREPLQTMRRVLDARTREAARDGERRVPFPSFAVRGDDHVHWLYDTIDPAELRAAAVRDRPGPLAAAELWRLASEWQVRPERAPTPCPR
jgi:protein-disulfide isomerase-like protein with CxxC motif